MPDNSYDFLTSAEEEVLRKQVENDLSSYSKYSDILAELLQNATDAIDESYYESPADSISSIHIDFNAEEGSISVTDTGTGMPWDVLKKAPSPNVSYKNNNKKTSKNKRSRGEKGVGLSFLTFVSNKLEVKSCDGTETTIATVKGANDWLINDENSQRPQMIRSEECPLPPSRMLNSSTYTHIKLSDIRTKVYSDRDIFDLSESELVYVIRTKTAIGNVSQIMSAEDPEPYIKVTLKFTNKNGEVSESIIPYRYLSPEEYITDSSKITFEQIKQLRLEEKEKQASGKALIYRKTHVTAGGKKIKCYAFAMEYRIFQSISADREEEGLYAPSDWSGIYIATRGMPTGIKIEPRTSSGYWKRIFLMLEDDDMRFDVGRKTLQGAAKPMMQKIADEVWKDIYSYLKKLSYATETISRKRLSQRMQLFHEALEQWTSLDLEAIQFMREPQREQMVVALFYELIGAGFIKGYGTLRNNTKDQYDAYIQYRIDKSLIGRIEAAGVSGKYLEELIIVEFKTYAEDLVRDLIDDNKDYRDIDVLVCWEINPEQLLKNNISVEPIAEESVFFHSSTHKLYFPGIYQIADNLVTIELKTIVERIKQNQ